MEDYNQRSWFSKNWPWVLPVGCCSGCLLVFLLFIGGIGATVLSVFSELKDASPIAALLIIANNNPKAKEILGTDIVSEGFPNGNISLNNDDGEVKFSIDIKGNKGAGTLYVNGIRANKKWIYEELYIIIKETAEQINLLENTAEIPI